MRIMRIAVVLVAAVALAGCGAGRPESEQAYLDAVYSAASERGSGIAGFGDDKNVALGRAVCEDLAAGKAPTEIVADLRQSGDAIGSVATEVVAFADVHLC